MILLRVEFSFCRNTMSNSAHNSSVGDCTICSSPSLAAKKNYSTNHLQSITRLSLKNSNMLHKVILFRIGTARVPSLSRESTISCSPWCMSNCIRQTAIGILSPPAAHAVIPSLYSDRPLSLVLSLTEGRQSSKIQSGSYNNSSSSFSSCRTSPTSKTHRSFSTDTIY